MTCEDRITALESALSASQRAHSEDIAEARHTVNECTAQLEGMAEGMARANKELIDLKITVDCALRAVDDLNAQLSDSERIRGELARTVAELRGEQDKAKEREFAAFSAGFAFAADHAVITDCGAGTSTEWPDGDAMCRAATEHVEGGKQ